MNVLEGLRESLNMIDALWQYIDACSWDAPVRAELDQLREECEAISAAYPAEQVALQAMASAGFEVPNGG